MAGRRLAGKNRKVGHTRRAQPGAEGDAVKVNLPALVAILGPVGLAGFDVTNPIVKLGIRLVVQPKAFERLITCLLYTSLFTFAFGKIGKEKSSLC